LALSESKNQVNQPSDKGDQGNKSPKRFHAHGTEIFAGDIDDCRDGEQIENDANFHPEKNSCGIQCYLVLLILVLWAMLVPHCGSQKQLAVPEKEERRISNL